VLIWDSGEFRSEGDPTASLNKGRLSFSLEGRKLKGTFSLILMKGRGSDKDWLLMKRQDSFADTTWKIEEVLTPARKKKLKEKIPSCQTS
jgi:bifunctional non-homologous end joining protein LigD